MTGPPPTAPEPPASEANPPRSYVELLAELEARRRAADDVLLRKMAPVLDAQAQSLPLPQPRKST